jgi:hypothetical protein
MGLITADSIGGLDRCGSFAELCQCQSRTKSGPRSLKRAPELRAAVGIPDARAASVRLSVCGAHEYAQFRPRER